MWLGCACDGIPESLLIGFITNNEAMTVREVIHQIQRNDAYVLVSDEVGKPSGSYKDDIIGQVLLDSLVKEAQGK